MSAFADEMDALIRQQRGQGRRTRSTLTGEDSDTRTDPFAPAPPQAPSETPFDQPALTGYRPAQTVEESNPFTERQPRAGTLEYGWEQGGKQAAIAGASVLAPKLVVPALGAAGSWAAEVATALRTGGVAAAARAGAPGAAKVAPIVEGVILGERGGPVGGLAGETLAASTVPTPARVARKGLKAINWNAADVPEGYHVEMLSPAEVMAKTEAWQRLDPVTGKGPSGIAGRLKRTVEYAESGAPMSPAMISRRKDGSIAFSDGRHRTVAAIQAGEDKVPFFVEDPYTGTNPFAIPEEVERLAADAIERKPGVQLAAGTNINKAIDSFKVAPGLEKITMPDDVTMRADRAYSGLLSRMAGAGDTAADRGRSIGMNDNPEFERLFREYLDLEDAAERAVVQEAEGLPNLNQFVSPITGKPMTAAELSQKAHDTKDALTGVKSVPSTTTPGNTMSVPNMPGGVEFFDENMAKVNTWRAEMAKRAVDTGQMKPRLVEDPDLHGPFIDNEVRKSYIPHIIEERVQEEALPGISNKSDANTLIYNALKNGDTEIKVGPNTGNYSVYTPLKQTGEKHATGSTKKLLGDPIQRLAVKAGQVERRALMNEFIDRLKPYDLTDQVLGGKVQYDHDTMRLYDVGGKRAVFPVQVAEALAKASKVNNPTALGRAWAEMNNLSKQGLLKWNPSFQLKQIMDDVGTGFSNVQWGKKKEFLKGVENHAKVLMSEFEKQGKGEYSDIIANYRKRGTMTEVYESLIDTQDEVKRISDKTLKGHSPDFIDRQAQIRETSIKSSLADIYKTMGATDERAVDFANKVTGDYISKSEGGKFMAELMPMTKWYATAIKRLTVDALEDPVGRGIGSASPELAGTIRGIKNSPYATLLPAAIAAAAWNMAVSGGKNSDFDGLLIPGTDQKIGIPGYATIASVFTGADSLKPGAGRFAPGIRSVYERLSGETIMGSPVNPFRSEENVSDAKQDATMVKRGGHPAFAGLAGVAREVPYLGAPFRDPFQIQADAEKFSSFPGQVRRAMDKDTSLQDRILSAVKVFSPLNITDVGPRNKALQYRDRDAAIDDYVNATTDKAHNAAKKAFIDAGGTMEQLMTRVKSGEREADKFLYKSKDQRAKWADFQRFKRGQ